ncbi:MAG TPA: redoxin family protein [Nevskiaceae bacterium]|nr:redoxin family protein [Nevskiaceae bacterium]
MRKILCAAGLATALCAAAAGDAPPAPAFTHMQAQDWLNSRPLTWPELSGHVVMVEFWAFDCWNCYRSIPWINALRARHPALQVIGVHTPELEQEYVRDNVVRKITELGVRHPVMIDNDYSYWNAMGNRYWPAFYLIDGHGRVRARYYGEMHEGDAQTRAIESVIGKLAAED